MSQLALIFDLDGVIIHSTPVHNQAWEEYLRPFGIPPDQVQTRMHGLRNDDIVRGFFGGDLSAEEVHAHGSAKEALFRSMMAGQIHRHIVPGVTEFLARHERRAMGLASNAERPNIDFVLDGAGIRSYFTAVVDGHQAARPKPYPDIYLKTADLLGVAPEDCVIFEDSLAGVEAAAGCGARVVGLRTTLEALPGVDLMISDFEDSRLEPWLGQLQLRG